MVQVQLSSVDPAREPHGLGSQTRARIAAVQTELGRLGVDGLLLYARGESDSGSAAVVRYLTGAMPRSEAVCWIPTVGDPVAVSSDKNAGRAWALVLQGQAVVFKTTDLIDTVRRVLGSAPARSGPVATAGLEEATRRREADLVALVRGRDTVDGAAIVTALRATRTQVEEDRQRAATRVADAMVQRCMQVAAIPGVTGLDIMSEVEYLGRRLGADRASCWLAIGERPAETYFQGYELATRVTSRDRVQIGTTVMVGGYFSQVLRIGVFGEPDRRLVDVSQALIAMQDAALAAMRPGDPVTRIGDVLEAGIDELCPYPRSEDPFRFQSCHAMGNSYSEPWSAPFLDADRDRDGDAAAPVISVHQTYEIHPNFTLPDLGHVCAGDVGLVTETGGRWISQTPRGVMQLA